MELERFKSAWQKRSMEGHSLSSAVHATQSLQYIRASAIRDLQRSDELSRFVFCLLFALVSMGASFIVMAPGAARVAAWLLAVALLADGLAGVALLVRRLREPATPSMLEFIRREQRQVETRLRFERYSLRFMLMLAAVILLLLIFAPAPINQREKAFENLERMAVVTAFLAVAWRKTKSRSRETWRELESYLNDFEK